ncbi:MAG TPA: transcriptional regulator [Nocardioides sp.]|uniref:transcriptional regulator n=1 Tax=Nocardioides sp. TaxID=35761 RepID=UPI002E32719A|nr:transcriptional regulator [Nocardioides sp.]HEX3932925.1 transcriptional regulator [Nocardioides sp.]
MRATTESDPLAPNPQDPSSVLEAADQARQRLAVRVWLRTGLRPALAAAMAIQLGSAAYGGASPRMVTALAGRVRRVRRAAGRLLMVELDPLIHAPARLQLVTMLSAVSEAEFATLRDVLEVSDSVLSKHISALAGRPCASTSRHCAGRSTSSSDRRGTGRRMRH